MVRNDNDRQRGIVHAREESNRIHRNPRLFSRPLQYRPSMRKTKRYAPFCLLEPASQENLKRVALWRRERQPAKAICISLSTSVFQSMNE